MKGMFLITGGSGGIGAVLANKLAKIAYTPLIAYNSNKEKAESLAQSLNGEAVFLNLLDLENVDRVVDDLATRDEILSGIFLGASATLNITSFGRITEQDMDIQWRTNVLGHQRLMAGLVRKVFRKAKRGIVIGVLSGAMGNSEKAGMTSMGSYIIAKYGLQGLLAVLKAEYSWLSIISISPGFTETSMLKAFDERFLESLRETDQIRSPEIVAQEILNQIVLLEKSLGSI